jgi:multidrug resistance efflux pump
VAAAVVLLVGGGFFAWRLYESSRYVATDNARVSAALIPVTTLAAGELVSLDVDLGSLVTQGQQVAQVSQPRAADSSTGQGYKASPQNPVRVEAPVSGYVAAVWAYPGTIISAGQPIVTLADPSRVWVTANVNENDAVLIRPGQSVEVTVDSLGGRRLQGKVEGMAAATAGSFSLLPSQNTSGNFTKVAQVVPVKISVVNPDGYTLIPGSSVEVSILVK